MSSSRWTQSTGGTCRIPGYQRIVAIKKNPDGSLSKVLALRKYVPPSPGSSADPLFLQRSSAGFDTPNPGEACPREKTPPRGSNTGRITTPTRMPRESVQCTFQPEGASTPKAMQGSRNPNAPQYCPISPVTPGSPAHSSYYYDSYPYSFAESRTIDLRDPSGRAPSQPARPQRCLRPPYSFAVSRTIDLRDPSGLASPGSPDCPYSFAESRTIDLRDPSALENPEQSSPASPEDQVRDYCPDYNSNSPPQFRTPPSACPSPSPPRPASAVPNFQDGSYAAACPSPPRSISPSQLPPMSPGGVSMPSFSSSRVSPSGTLRCFDLDGISLCIQRPDEPSMLYQTPTGPDYPYPIYSAPVCTPQSPVTSRPRRHEYRPRRVIPSSPQNYSPSRQNISQAASPQTPQRYRQGPAQNQAYGAGGMMCALPPSQFSSGPANQSFSACPIIPPPSGFADESMQYMGYGQPNAFDVLREELEYSPACPVAFTGGNTSTPNCPKDPEPVDACSPQSQKQSDNTSLSSSSTEKPKMNEADANEALDEMIDTTIHGFNNIVSSLKKRQPIRCILDLPSDRDKLNMLLQDNIAQTESNLSNLRKSMQDTLMAMSNIIAKRTAVQIPEISNLVNKIQSPKCQKPGQSKTEPEKKPDTAAKTDKEAEKPSEEEKKEGSQEEKKEGGEKEKKEEGTEEKKGEGAEEKKPEGAEEKKDKGAEEKNEKGAEEKKGEGAEEKPAEP